MLIEVRVTGPVRPDDSRASPQSRLRILAKELEEGNPSLFRTAYPYDRTLLERIGVGAIPMHWIPSCLRALADEIEGVS